MARKHARFIPSISEVHQYRSASPSKCSRSVLTPGQDHYPRCRTADHRYRSPATEIGGSRTHVLRPTFVSPSHRFLPINENELAVTLRSCDLPITISRYLHKLKTCLIKSLYNALRYLVGTKCSQYVKRKTDKNEPPPDPTCAKTTANLVSSNKAWMPLSVNLK